MHPCVIGPTQEMTNVENNALACKVEVNVKRSRVDSNSFFSQLAAIVYIYIFTYIYGNMFTHIFKYTDIDTF